MATSAIVKVDEAKLAEIMSAEDRSIVAIAESFSVANADYSVTFIVVAIDQNKFEELKESLDRIRAAAESFEITDGDSYDLAWSMRQECKKSVDTFLGMFKESKELLHRTHRDVTALEKGCVTPYVLADQALEKKRIEYANKIKAEDEARRQREQQEAEARQKKELAEEAKRLEKAGDKEAAKEVRAIARTAPTPTVALQPTLGKQSGSISKRPWLFRVINPELIPREFLLPAQGKELDPASYPRIRKVVNALGDKSNIAGIEPYQEERESVRRS